MKILIVEGQVYISSDNKSHDHDQLASSKLRLILAREFIYDSVYTQGKLFIRAISTPSQYLMMHSNQC